MLMQYSKSFKMAAMNLIHLSHHKIETELFHLTTCFRHQGIQ